MLSWLLVIIQLGALALIAVTGPLIPANLWLFGMEAAAAALAVWAVLTLGIGNFNIVPDVKQDARLVTGGPYRLIRHPIYTALLLGALPMIINTYTPFRLALWLILLVDLLAKLYYEERLLQKALPGYAEYMKTSHRLIPFIY